MATNWQRCTQRHPGAQAPNCWRSHTHTHTHTHTHARTHRHTHLHPGVRARATASGSTASPRSMFWTSCRWLAPCRAGVGTQFQPTARNCFSTWVADRGYMWDDSPSSLAELLVLARAAGDEKQVPDSPHSLACRPASRLPHLEGRAARQQLEQNGAHGPQVGLGVVAGQLQHLGRHVKRTATQRLGHAWPVVERMRVLFNMLR